MRLILASSSPRRREILTDMGYEFEVISPDVEELEGLEADDTPADFVLENALIKGEAVAAMFPNALVLAADTTVAFDGEVLNKPADIDEARAMIRRLSGKTHTVYTGYQLMHEISDIMLAESVESEVTFKEMSDADIDAYFKIVNPLDKAGAYGIQDGRELIIEKLEGSFTNVMGLPKEALAEALDEFEQITGATVPKRS